MRLLFTILFLCSFSGFSQGYLLSKYGKTSNVTYAPPDPTIDDSTHFKIVIHYNDVDWTYNDTFPGKYVIKKATTMPDSALGALEANTGLAYDFENHRLLVVSVRTVERWFDRDLNQTGTTPISVAGQGVAYNGITGQFYELTTASVKVKNSSGTISQTLTFPSTQPSPGTIDYDYATQNFYCSYDNQGFIRIWHADFGAGTITPVDTINSIGANEGSSLNPIDRTIWYNYTGASVQRRQIDSAGNLLNSITWVANSRGAIHEGLVVDPTDGTVYHNSDSYYHSPIPKPTGANETWHTDPNRLYNKYFRIPDQIRWEECKLSGLTIRGIYNDSYLYGAGTCITPVLDFGSYDMQETAGNRVSTGAGTWEYRGSDFAPTTAASTQFVRDYYEANLTNDGWGSTIPGSWSSSWPTGKRYVQMKLTITGLTN